MCASQLSRARRDALPRTVVATDTASADVDHDNSAKLRVQARPRWCGDAADSRLAGYSEPRMWPMQVGTTSRVTMRAAVGADGEVNLAAAVHEHLCGQKAHG